MAPLVMELGILLGGQNLWVSSNGCSPIPEVEQKEAQRLFGWVLQATLGEGCRLDPQPVY